MLDVSRRSLPPPAVAPVLRLIEGIDGEDEWDDADPATAATVDAAAAPDTSNQIGLFLTASGFQIKHEGLFLGPDSPAFGWTS